MDRFIKGVSRSQTTLFPDRLEGWIDEDNPVRVIDAFVDALDLSGLEFIRATAAGTGRPGYHHFTTHCDDMVQTGLRRHVRLPGLAVGIVGQITRSHVGVRAGYNSDRPVQLCKAASRLVPAERMILVPASTRIWLAGGIADMRNGFVSITPSAQSVILQDPQLSVSHPD